MALWERVAGEGWWQNWAQAIGLFISRAVPAALLLTLLDASRILTMEFSLAAGKH